jgi:hypothetical protein
MKKVSLDVWVQLIGLLSIVGGLVFVGLEMRQSQQIAIGAQQQSRAQMSVEGAYVWLETGLDPAIMYKTNTRNFTQEETFAVRNEVNAWLYIYESDYEQYQLGLMSEEIWKAKEKGLNMLLNVCIAADVYEFRSPAFSDEFRAIVESLPIECTE